MSAAGSEVESEFARLKLTAFKYLCCTECCAYGLNVILVGEYNVIRNGNGSSQCAVSGILDTYVDIEYRIVVSDTFKSVVLFNYSVSVVAGSGVRDAIKFEASVSFICCCADNSIAFINEFEFKFALLKLTTLKYLYT